MFKETGKIIGFEGGQANIQMLQSDNCNHCGAKTACSGLGGGERIIRLPVGPNLHVNDLIELSFESSTRIASAIIVFLLPVFAMIAGLAIAIMKYGDADKYAIIGSFGGLAIGFVLVWLINKLLAKKAVWNPVVRKI